MLCIPCKHTHMYIRWTFECVILGLVCFGAPVCVSVYVCMYGRVVYDYLVD
jgi:hypothetical protein